MKCMHNFLYMYVGCSGNNHVRTRDAMGIVTSVRGLLWEQLHTSIQVLLGRSRSIQADVR
jgi:hypothetical protein